MKSVFILHLVTCPAPVAPNIPQGIRLTSQLLPNTQWTAGRQLQYVCDTCYTGFGGSIICREIPGQNAGSWAYLQPAQQCIGKSSSR